jgi:hypothetical protein
MIKESFNRNKGYLAMLFLSSLTIGVGIAALSAAFPAVLSAFAGLTLLGVAPLAFLTTLSAPLATLTLGFIITGISAVLIAASLASTKQLASIGTHIYSLFTMEKEVVVPVSEESYNFLNKYLHPNASEHFDDVDDDEFHELSSDSSDEEDEQPRPTVRTESREPVESGETSRSMSLS